MPLLKNKGWHLETDARCYGHVAEWELKWAVAGVALGRLEYAILTPPGPVRGCVYMQFCQDGAGKLHVEYAFPDAQHVNWVKGRDGVSLTELNNLTADLVGKRWIPDTSRWETMGCFAQRYDPAVYLAILEHMGGRELAEAFRPALLSPDGWYMSHLAQYGRRGVSRLCAAGTILWTGMADLLLEKGRMAEVRAKISLPDFLETIRTLNPELPVEESWFDPKATPARWCSACDRRWWDTGLCMGAFDLRNGKLLLFITSRTRLGALRELAQQIGERIDLAKRITDI